MKRSTKQKIYLWLNILSMVLFITVIAVFFCTYFSEFVIGWIK